MQTTHGNAPTREMLLGVLDGIEVERTDRLGSLEARAQTADAILAILDAPRDPAVPPHMMKHARLKRLMNYLVFQGVPREQLVEILALVADYTRPDYAVGALAKARDRTDIGLAERLADWFGPDIARSPGLGWHSWTGTHWKAADTKEVLQSRAKQAARRVNKEANDLAAEYAAWEPAEGDTLEQADKTREIQKQDLEAAKRFAKAAQTIGKINAMMDLVISEPGITFDDDAWDANPALLGTPGGTLVLDDQVTMHPPRRTDRITRVTAERWEDGAQRDSVAWMGFLADTLPDPAVQRYFQKLMGYSLWGANPERLFAFLVGKTSTGKSTVLAIIAKVLGDHAKSFNMSLLRGKLEAGPQPDLIEAMPARLLHASETSERWQLHSDEIKRFTGGTDELKARKMRSDHYVSRAPAFLPVVATNSPPTIVGGDTALFRRLVAIPFEQQISKADEDTRIVDKIIETDGDAVLDWLVAGGEAYRREGLRDIPDAVVRATMDLRDALSILDTWLAEECESGAEYGGDTKRDVWHAYASWCGERGVSDKDRGSEISFSKTLKGKGYTDGFTGSKEKRQRVWHGFRLSSTAGQDAAR